jgi:hypothetical protein
MSSDAGRGIVVEIGEAGRAVPSNSVQAMTAGDQATCATCRHWLPDATEDDRWGVCWRAEGHRGHACDRASLTVAVDGAAWRAYLCTAAAFGCVQWEVAAASVAHELTWPRLPDRLETE